MNCTITEIAFFVKAKKTLENHPISVGKACDVVKYQPKDYESAANNIGYFHQSAGVIAFRLAQLGENKLYRFVKFGNDNML